MIKIILPGRAPAPSKPYYPVSTPANTTEIRPLTASRRTVNVVVERDKIIREWAAKCTYKPGDTAYPTSDEGREKYGECFVRGIAKSYAEYGNYAWPKNNNPMIVSAWSTKQKAEFVCTINYLAKEKEVTVEEVENSGV